MKLPASAPPTIRLLGPSGSGKTTLGERLVRTLRARGYRVATIKNALKHPAPADRESSDTQRYRDAGVVAGVGRFEDGVVIGLPEADLETLLTMLGSLADIVLVEGFHEAELPTLLFAAGERRYEAAHVLATIVADPAAAAPPGVLHRDDIEGVAGVVEDWVRRGSSRAS